eukprot:238508_1
MAVHVSHIFHLLITFVLHLFLHGPISICIAKETISVNTTWQIKSDDITCSQTEEDICIIQCNTPYSCGSHDTTIARPHITCPLFASSCIINCMDEGSCRNSVIDTGNAELVEINIHHTHNNQMIINAPSDGDLYITLLSDEATFDSNVIHAHGANNIYLDCIGEGSCQRNQINAESVATGLHITCRNGSNCDGQEIHCPDNNKPHIIPECNILCDFDSDTLTSCSGLNIFAMNGTNQRNGVYYECNGRDPAICAGSTVYCRRGEVCDMKYDIVNGEWYCEGLCGGKTSEPTRSPSFAPTMNPINTTETPQSSSQSTNDMWFGPLNTTMANYNAIMTVVQESSFMKHNLEVLAYILIGCLIGGLGFCLCVVCATCCFVEGRLKRYQSTNSAVSSVDYEYYGSNPQVPANKSATCGSHCVSAIKNRLNAIAALTSQHINHVPNESPIQEAYEPRNATQQHLKPHQVFNASPSSKRANPKKNRFAQGPEVFSPRKQSNSSSSSSSCSSGSETVCSDSRSTTYGEYGDMNTCQVQIKSTGPLQEKNGLLETQEIAISVNTSPRSRKRIRYRSRRADEEKACELHEDDRSSDTSFNDETCSACTMCGHEVIDPEEDTSEEDIYDAYEDGMPNDGKRYRIEVSGPSETRSPRRTESS